MATWLPCKRARYHFYFIALLFVLVPSTHSATVPAIFILGDSLVDVGNNNFLNSLAKGNVKFNGIDVGNGTPTGRFCNGRTVIDVLGGFLGLPPPPPYLDPSTRGAAILKGVNYASGAGGILPSSGYNYISRVSFDEQLTYFDNTRADLANLLGQAQSSSLINRSLYFIVFGSNDYINNYLLRSSQYASYSPSQFRDLLVSKLRQQLTALYNSGARNVVFSNVGPLGCIPSQISQKSPNGQCVTSINDLVFDYNAAVANMLEELPAQLPGFRFVISNGYGVISRIINNGAAYGFKYTNAGCCGLGPLRGRVPCTPFANLCNDRRDYVFWDPFHPTDAANAILANSFYSGTAEDSSPMNLRDFVATM